MQKVITVTTHTNTTEKESNFAEAEYPLLDSYLEQGFVVVQVVPVTTASTNSYMYSLTFVLSK